MLAMVMKELTWSQLLVSLANCACNLHGNYLVYLVSLAPLTFREVGLEE